MVLGCNNLKVKLEILMLRKNLKISKLRLLLVAPLKFLYAPLKFSKWSFDKVTSELHILQASGNKFSGITGTKFSKQNFWKAIFRTKFPKCMKCLFQDTFTWNIFREELFWEHIKYISKELFEIHFFSYFLFSSLPASFFHFFLNSSSDDNV